MPYFEQIRSPIGRVSELQRFLIINTGAAKLNLTFTRDAKFRICRLSSGYPHFTHLIALKASEVAIVNEIAAIDIEIVNDAIEKSISDCENSLRQSYDETV